MGAGRKQAEAEGLRGGERGGPKRGFGSQEVEVSCCSMAQVLKLRHLSKLTRLDNVSGSHMLHMSHVSKGILKPVSQRQRHTLLIPAWS